MITSSERSEDVGESEGRVSNVDDYVCHVDYYHNSQSTTTKRDFKAAFKRASRAANLTIQQCTVPERLVKDCHLRL